MGCEKVDEVGGVALARVPPHSLYNSALLGCLTRKGCNLNIFALFCIIEVNRTEDVDS